MQTTPESKDPFHFHTLSGAVRNSAGMLGDASAHPGNQRSLQGSFDCGIAPLREAIPPLRMTKNSG